MLTPDFLDALPGPILELFEEFEQSVIEDIARRIAKLGKVTSTSAWQAQRLSESGMLYEAILDRLAELTGKSELELARLFRKAGVKALRFDDAIYRAAGLNPLPLNLSPAMVETLAAGLRKTGGIMRNLTQTTAISGQRAFEQAADLAYMQISSGAFDYNTAIKAAVRRTAEEGLKVINYASGRQDQLDVAIRRCVLTGVNQTVGVLQERRADEMNSDLVQTTAHIGARPEHEIWQGRIFSRSGAHPKYPDFVTETGYGTATGLLGINCVLGDTLVSSLGVRAAYRREYTGEVVTIRTARGHELTVTPNHPILTDQGWVAAGLLKCGDNVISRAAFNGNKCPSPDVYKDEPRIEDVYSALLERGDMLRFPASSGYFHGDISNGKIDAIFPQGLLWDRIDGALPEHQVEVAFCNASEPPGTLPSNGSIDEILFRSDHSPNCIMGGLGESGASLGSSSFEPDPHSIGPVFSKRNTELGEILSNQSLGNPNFSGDLILPEAGIVQGKKFIGSDTTLSQEIGLPIFAHINAVSSETVDNSLQGTPVLFPDSGCGYAGRIELDNIVFIERKSTEGSFVHVYNLETEDGRYYANGIVTHNCRHSWFPFFEGISENAYSRATLNAYADKTVTWRGKKISFYDATQEQRSIERRIRHWKRQAGAMEAAGLDNTVELSKVRDWQSKYRSFSAQTGLKRQMERQRVFGTPKTIVGEPSKRIIPFDEKLDPGNIAEINPITDQDKYMALMQDFSTNGWSGNPILVKDLGNNNYQALTGSHRVLAAKTTGTDVPSVIVRETMGKHDDLWESLENITEDEDRLEIIEKLHKHGEVPAKALDLMKIEVENNYYLDKSSEYSSKAGLYKAAQKAKKEAMAIEQKAHASVPAINEAAQSVYQAAFHRMKAKYGESLWSKMTDDEIELLEKLERMVYKK